MPWVLRWLATTALLAASAVLHAQDKISYGDNRLVVQYAGHLGQFALGVEQIIGPRSSFQLMAGHASATTEGIDIFVAAAKVNRQFAPLFSNPDVVLRLHTGMGLYHYFGPQYRDDKYPENYYTHPATGWNLMPYLGLSLSDSAAPRHRITAYAEAGILDAYLIHYYNNRQTIPFRDIVTLAVGISMPLR